MSTLLKKQREDLGKDISDVAAITRIKESCLRAIEDEDYDKLPVEVYARGYIREYAKYLGVAADNALAPYEKYLEIKNKKERKIAVPEPEVPVHAAAKQEKAIHEVSRPVEQALPEIKREEAKSDKRKIIWTVLLLFIVGLAIVYQFVSSRNAERETQIAPLFQGNQPAQPQATQPQPTQPGTETQAKPEAPASSENKPSAEESKIPAEPAIKKHVLQIIATDTAWVQVTMDGTQTRQALMQRGDVATYEANENISFVVGNAGGVTMKFDGKELPAGKKGEVLRLSLPAGAKPQPAKPKTDTRKSIKKTPAKNDSDLEEEQNETAPASKKPAGASKP